PSSISRPGPPPPPTPLPIAWCPSSHDAPIDCRSSSRALRGEAALPALRRRTRRTPPQEYLVPPTQKYPLGGTQEPTQFGRCGPPPARVGSEAESMLRLA